MTDILLTLAITSIIWIGVLIGLLLWFKRLSDRWVPVGKPVIASGKLWVVEWNPKQQVYRYIQVPSFKKMEEMLNR